MLCILKYIYDKRPLPFIIVMIHYERIYFGMYFKIHLLQMSSESCCVSNVDFIGFMTSTHNEKRKQADRGNEVFTQCAKVLQMTHIVVRHIWIQDGSHKLILECGVG